MMGKIIVALEHFDRQTLRNRTHPLVGPASQHCSLIRGGSGLSTYAEECKLQIERRTLPGETPQRVMGEWEEMIRCTGEQAQLRRLLDRPPLTCDANAKVATSLCEAARSVTGQTPEIAGVELLDGCCAVCGCRHSDGELRTWRRGCAWGCGMGGSE